MAEIIELNDSRVLVRGIESGSATYKYMLKDYTSVDAAIAALAEYSPQVVYVYGAPCTDREVTVTPISADADKSLFAGSVSWSTADTSGGGSGDGNKPKEPKEPEDPSSFSFTMGSIEDVKLVDWDQLTYSPFTPSGDRTEEGINKQHPELPPEGEVYNLPIVNIEVKTVFHKNVVTNDWLKDKHAQLWTVNDSPWRSLPHGCVMFSGFDGYQRNNDGHWIVTYRFEYRPPRAGRTWSAGEAGTFQTPTTYGWQNLSAHFDNFTVDEGDEDKPKERVVRKLSCVRIFNLYDSSDFTNLGIKY